MVGKNKPGNYYKSKICVQYAHQVVKGKKGCYIIICLTPFFIKAIDITCVRKSHRK